MDKNLRKRLLTSAFLLILLFFMLTQSVILISSLLIIFVLVWIEFNNLIDRIFIKKDSFFLKKIFQFFLFMYLLIFMKIIIDDFIDNQPNISWSLVFAITVCILSDVGGYVFGKFFKGKKLTKISPNKTYSGMLGSFLLSVAFGAAYSYTISFVDLKIIIFISFLISLICQLGDLFISYLKRKSGVKDTGNILPGHGGVLDRIDGIIFAVPFGIFLINIFF